MRLACLLTAFLSVAAQQPPTSLDLLDRAIRALTDLRQSLLGPPVVVVPQGGDLSAAIATAAPGTVLELEPGPRAFEGNFRARPNLTFRTRGLQLPGRRPTLDECGAMARVETANNAPALQVPPGVHQVRIAGLRFSGPANDVVLFGAGDESQTTLDQAPRDVAIDQSCVFGPGAKNGISVHSASTSVTRTLVYDVIRDGFESHGIAGYNGPGPFLLEDNHVRHSVIGVFFGGALPRIPQLVPADITVRGNLLQDFTKNAIECKACRRITIAENVVEDVRPVAQSGWGFQITPSQEAAAGVGPWAIVEDYVFEKNIVRQVGGLFNILGHGQNQTTAGRATLVSRNITIRQNWLQCDIARGGFGALALLGNGPINVAFEQNTIECNGDAFLRKSDRILLPGFRYTGNLQVVTGRYAIFTPLGQMSNAQQTAIVLTQFPGGIVTGNGFIGAPTAFRAALPENFFAATSPGLIEAGYGVGAAAAYGRAR